MHFTNICFYFLVYNQCHSFSVQFYMFWQMYIVYNQNTKALPSSPKFPSYCSFVVTPPLTGSNTDLFFILTVLPFQNVT